MPKRNSSRTFDFNLFDNFTYFLYIIAAIAGNNSFVVNFQSSIIGIPQQQFGTLQWVEETRKCDTSLRKRLKHTLKVKELVYDARPIKSSSIVKQNYKKNSNNRASC